MVAIHRRDQRDRAHGRTRRGDVRRQPRRAFALGLLLGLVESRFPETPRWIGSGLSIGVLGGFTTFSSYTLDAVRQVEDGRWALAGAYIVGTVALGLIAAVAGLALGRSAG